MRTLVLGCATGIGNAGARLLAARGDRLALGDIDGPGVAALAAELGAESFQVDAVKTGDLQAFVDAAADALGGLDYVWSNVGVQIAGSVEEASADDFDRSFAINVRAHAIVCGAAVPHLRAAGGGAICITASNSALLSEPKLAPYAVTKAAAVALARQVARDYSGEGIRVNALCPGWIDTPFNTPSWENFGGRERFLEAVPRPRAARSHRKPRGGGEAGVLPALGRCGVHDRPRARRRRRRVAARLSPPCAASRTTGSPTRCRPAIASRSASTRCCASAPRWSRGSRWRMRGPRRAPSCCSGTRPTGSSEPSAASSRGMNCAPSDCRGRRRWSSAPGARSGPRWRPRARRSHTARARISAAARTMPSPTAAAASASSTTW